jgi:energy-coupling factor transporter ATP-binding protein EcfA2
MQRIRKVTLNNFKFFHGEVEIDFAGKNVLIYGENGSGKSGIYWALYTFFQSVFKADIASIRKYFDPKSGENLINVFDRNSTGSFIKVSFSDGTKEIEKIISLNRTTTRIGPVVKSIAKVSDFFNYKFLFQLYNFRNSEEVDLFPDFERDILPFVAFRKSLVRHDGVAGGTSASEWWNYINAGVPVSVLKRSPEFKIFRGAVDEFNSEFNYYLDNIRQTANEYIRGRFNENLRIFLDNQRAHLIDLSGRRYATSPKIRLKTELLNDNLIGGKEVFTRPQVFLNEAKLTSVALAIRFAIVNEKYVKGEPRTLVFDDLLISLDMSNRDKILELLFDEFLDTSQMIILTHDKSFFELVRREIDYRSKAEDWIAYEMFVDEKDGFAKPFITPSKSLMAKARNYFDEKDYPACANHLRQAAEEILDRLVPSIYRRGKDGTEIRELGSLARKGGKLWKAWEHLTLREDLSRLCPLLQRLDKYKDTLLNPLSHFNAYSQIYREELKTTIDTLMHLEEAKNDVLIPVDSIVNVEFLTIKGISYRYTAELKDDIRQFKFGGEPSFYGRCKVELLVCVISSNPLAIYPAHRICPYKKISDFVDGLAAATHARVIAADPADAILRSNFETEFTFENKPLSDLHVY